MGDDDPIEDLAAVALSSAAIQAALIRHLKTLGIIDERDEAEIYEQALLLIETQQAGNDSTIFAAARELIEENLRPKR